MVILWMSREKFEDMVRRIKLQAYYHGHLDGRKHQKHRCTVSAKFAADMHIPQKAAK